MRHLFLVFIVFQFSIYVCSGNILSGKMRVERNTGNNALQDNGHCLSEPGMRRTNKIYMVFALAFPDTNADVSKREIRELVNKYMETSSVQHYTIDDQIKQARQTLEILPGEQLIWRPKNRFSDEDVEEISPRPFLSSENYFIEYDWASQKRQSPEKEVGQIVQIFDNSLEKVTMDVSHLRSKLLKDYSQLTNIMRNRLHPRMTDKHINGEEVEHIHFDKEGEHLSGLK